ncbi:MAG: discoidin domain-containing protein [Bacteroidetes bacterium]|jgi:hypothetical protein|nr:discoidin domain-containing protein [Bacteroidota bacterium]
MWVFFTFKRMLNFSSFHRCLLVWLLALPLFGQGVKIGGQGQVPPHASAGLELGDTNRGFLPPRLTTAQRNSIQNPSEGLQIYNLDLHCMEFYRGTNIGWYSPCPVPPQVQTDSIDNLWSQGFRVHYTVLSDGGSALIERGVCYDTLSGPDTSNSKVTTLPGLGSTAHILVNLLPGRTYYVRSFVVAQGIPVAYGNELSIQTPSIKAGSGQSLPGTQFAASSVLDAPRTAPKAFDNSLDDITGCWHSNSGDVSNAWIRVQFTTPQVVQSYAMWRRWGNDHIPSNWVMEGSNNGSSWTSLDVRSNSAPPIVTSGLSPVQSPFGLYFMNNSTPYLYYRLRSSATVNNSSYTVIGELLLMGP